MPRFSDKGLWIPAFAGMTVMAGITVLGVSDGYARVPWIPAFAGMTVMA